MYKIVLYTNLRGENLLLDFLKTIGPKASSKIQKYITLLSHEGPNMRRPHADYLGDGIYELRVKFNNNYRVLYFFFSGTDIVLTHGFVKKSDAVPQSEILKALKYKLDFERRKEIKK